MVLAKVIVPSNTTVLIFTLPTATYLNDRFYAYRSPPNLPHRDIPTTSIRIQGRTLAGVKIRRVECSRQQCLGFGETKGWEGSRILLSQYAGTFNFGSGYRNDHNIPSTQGSLLAR